MSQASSKTKPCPYCRGAKVRSGVARNRPGEIVRFAGACGDCDGTGEVCILCIRPTSRCTCGAHQFDDDKPQ